VFFVSVTSKGFNKTVSLLFAALTGRYISVAAEKDLTEGSGPDRVPDRIEIFDRSRSRRIRQSPGKEARS